MKSRCFCTKMCLFGFYVGAIRREILCWEMRIFYFDKWEYFSYENILDWQMGYFTFQFLLSTCNVLCENVFRVSSVFVMQGSRLCEIAISIFMCMCNCVFWHIFFCDIFLIFFYCRQCCRAVKLAISIPLMWKRSMLVFRMPIVLVYSFTIAFTECLLHKVLLPFMHKSSTKSLCGD